MADEIKAWSLLKTSARRSARLSIVIPIVFGLTAVITILSSVFLPDTYEGAIQVLIRGLIIGFSIILVFYLINWFFCLSFLRETKNLEIEEDKLRRLISMNRYCCILFMIPIVFFVGMFGFHKVKTFAEGNVQKGTLDQILYHYLIEK
ncbi:hypothetical protein [Oceanobacillus saliphilus]|uniref:hypothetical protein n=1 Tax=Oceanobacillus saliphilus TaxID=2925834 RepID=UPI00201D9C39|nr:hypothetical protein [Oceanobacillus saliphilus]